MVEREAEVEGPGAGTHDQVVWQFGKERRVWLLGWELAVCRPDGDSQLDGFEEIDVATQGLVVIRGLVFKVTYRARDNSGKLGVLYARVLVMVSLGLDSRRHNVPCSRMGTL
jgi:hypothetical protein